VVASTRSDERPSVTAVASREHVLTRSLIVLAVAVLWLRPIGSSFWLDELGTYWVVRRGLRDTIDLALRFQGQSPAYYSIAWAARVIGNGSEIVLRLPSLVAGAVAALFVARLGRTLFGREAGWISGVAFSVTPLVAFSAVDARPYAFAYLGLAAATLSLVRLWESGQRRWSLAYGVAVAATVHFHYLFGFALLGHLLFIVRRWRTMSSGARHAMWAAAIVTALLLLPLVAQVPYLARHAAIPDVPRGDPSIDSFLGILAPVPLVAGALLGWVVARASRPIDIRPSGVEGSLTLSASLWLAPPLGLLLFSLASGINLLWATYARSSAIGSALLLGAAISALHPERARRSVLLTLVIVALLATGGRSHGNQDWRGAAATVNAVVYDPSTPVLMHAAFIEGASVALLADPDYRDALLAQISRYPVEGSIVPIPYDLSPKAERYLEERVLPRVEASHRFVLVTLEPTAPFDVWLEGRLAPFGFEAREIGDHGSVQVTLFERNTNAGTT
jgi:hypothetical protein